MFAGKGFGLIVNEFIKKDEIVWWPTRDTVAKIKFADLESLPEKEKSHWIKYGYLIDDIIYVDRDDSLFTNHSCDPNTYDDENFVKAKTDIMPGQEMTWNYLPYILPKHQFECKCGSDNCKKTIKVGIHNSQIIN
jgi:hypothetical protein